MIRKTIKGGDFKSQMVGELVFDQVPEVGSFNPVTSDAVAKIAGGVADLDAIVPEGASEENKLATAADVSGVQEDVDAIEGKIPSDTSTTNKLVNESGLQDAIDNASESWSTGFTPKGESSVSDINDLATQSNGDSYIVTDSGTLTDGSLAVVAGDQVAWDATNSVWYKMPQYALRRAVDNISDSIATEFVPNSTTTVAGLPYMYKDLLYVAKVSGYQGPWNASKFTETSVSGDDFQDFVAQHTLSGNVAPEFDPTRTSGNPYKAEEKVVYNGKVYIFKVDHYGAWSSSDVDDIPYDTDAAITRVPLSVGGYSMAGDYVGDIVSSATGYRGCKFNAPVGTKVYVHGASAGATYRVWATFDSEGKFVRKADPNINGYSHPFFVTLDEGEAGIALNTAFNSDSDRWFGLVSVAENMVVVFDNLKSIKSQVAENTSAIEEVNEAVDEISEETIVPIEATDNLDFTNVKTSATYYPNFVADTTRASTIVFEVCPGTDLTFACGTDYDFVLFSSSSPTEVADWQDSGWKAGGSTVTCNNRYANLLVRTSSTNPSGLGATIDATALAYLSASNITYYPYNVVKNPKGIGDVKRVEKIAGSAENPFRFGSFYYYHVLKSGDAVVTPQQSLYDVDAAARLGFKVFEVNTLKVADGYLMQHGQTANTFANNTVTDLQGNYANGIDISGMTIAAIKAAYRYKARYPKQRTPVTELTEGLVEMKKRGMIPFFSFNVTGADAYRAKVREIFGNDYIAYQGSEDKDATMIMNWSSLSTKEAIVAYCKLRKPPYLHMPSTETISNWILANCKAWAEDPTISDAKTYFNSLSESDQKALIVYQIEWFRDLADAVHNEGFIIGWAANYSDEETNQLLMMSGWDCAASGRGVNDFEHGNLVNVSADLNFDDFAHPNSTESNGVLSVPVNGNVYASGTIPVCYLGKVAMHIRFNGTLKFTTAGQGNFTLVNDGTRDMYISSIILDNSPQIWIQAITATDIYDLSFKSSRC